MKEHGPSVYPESLTADERQLVLERVGRLLPAPETLGIAPDVYEAEEGTIMAHHLLAGRAVTLWGYLAPTANYYEEIHIFASEPVIEEQGVIPHKIISSEYWIIDNSGAPDNDYYGLATRLTDSQGYDMLQKIESGEYRADEVVGGVLRRLSKVHNRTVSASPHQHFPELVLLLDQLGPHNRVKTFN
jgi:hypothetical protein